jgi:hypothetical protein
MKDEEVAALQAQSQAAAAARGSMGIGEWPQRHLDLGLARGRPSDRLGRLDHPVERAGAVPLIRISFQPLRTADRTIDGGNLPAGAEVTLRPFGICGASFRGNGRP